MIMAQVEAPVAEVEAPPYTRESLDRARVEDALRAAYAPVSLKLEGNWKVITVNGEETWTWEKGQWTCPQSSLSCQDWVPESFRWFQLGRMWLAGIEARSHEGLDISGYRRSAMVRQPVVLQDESSQEVDLDVEVVQSSGPQFEGKRTALDLWKFRLPISEQEVLIGISKRDFMVERLVTAQQSESLEWVKPEGSASTGLSQVMIERNGQSVLFKR
jgi:hypothetical protein